MDEKIGLKLIEELKNEPEKFCKGGEVISITSRDTLRELFYLENNSIRQLVNAQDLDVREFSRGIVNAKIKTNRLLNGKRFSTSNYR